MLLFFVEQDDPHISKQCADDDHDECDGAEYDRKTNKEISKCHCYCHKPEPEPEQ